MRKTLLICLTVAACGPAYGPLKNYEASRDAYRKCLVAKGEAACTSEKAVMDHDAKVYSVASGQTLRTGAAD